MQRLNRQQLANLVLLTLVWGLNWPVMKMGVSNYPALTFRALSIMLGVPVLALALALMKVPFRVPRRYWPELLGLTVDQHADLAGLHHPGGAEPVQRTRRDPGLHHADLLGHHRLNAVLAPR